MESFTNLISLNNTFIDLDREEYKRLFQSYPRFEHNKKIRIVLKPSQPGYISVAGFNFNEGQDRPETQWFYKIEFIETIRIKTVFDEFLIKSQNLFGITDQLIPKYPDDSVSVDQSYTKIKEEEPINDINLTKDRGNFERKDLEDIDIKNDSNVDALQISNIMDHSQTPAKEGVVDVSGFT